MISSKHASSRKFPILTKDMKTLYSLPAQVAVCLSEDHPDGIHITRSTQFTDYGKRRKTFVFVLEIEYDCPGPGKFRERWEQTKTRGWVQRWWEPVS